MVAKMMILTLKDFWMIYIS